jgi:OTT_1508-like deaminase
MKGRQLLNHDLPELREQLREHVKNKYGDNPVLATLMSTDQVFCRALWSLVDALDDSIEWLGRQSQSAFVLSSVPDGKDHLGKLIGDDHITGEIWKCLYAVAKFAKIWNTFGISLQNLPQLRFLSIVYLSTPESQLLSILDPQSMKKTLRRCGLPPDATGVQAFIGRAFSVEDAQTLHKKFQSLQPMVHAEVQVIAHLLPGSDNVFQYLGTSAKPCFLCHHLAQHFNFETQPPDFNQHSSWKVPELANISVDKLNFLIRALCNTAKIMKAKLLIPVDLSPETEDDGLQSYVVPMSDGFGKR